MRLSRGTLLLSSLLVLPEVREGDLALDVDGQLAHLLEVVEPVLAVQAGDVAEHLALEELAHQTVLPQEQVRPPGLVLLDQVLQVALYVDQLRAAFRRVVVLLVDGVDQQLDELLAVVLVVVVEDPARS